MPLWASLAAKFLLSLHGDLPSVVSLGRFAAGPVSACDFFPGLEVLTTCTSKTSPCSPISPMLRPAATEAAGLEADTMLVTLSPESAISHSRQEFTDVHGGSGLRVRQIPGAFAFCFSGSAGPSSAGQPHSSRSAPTASGQRQSSRCWRRPRRSLLLLMSPLRYLGLQLWADCEAASPTQRVGGHSEFRNWQAGHWLRMKCGCPVIVLKQNHLLCVPPEFSRRAGSLVCCPSSTSACVTADWPRQKPRRGRVRLCSWQPATDAP